MAKSNLSGLGFEGVPGPSEKSSTNPGGSIKGTGMGGAKKSGSPFTSPWDPTPPPGGEAPAGGGKSPSGSSDRVDNVR